ncbi:MAG: glycoside hydrolase family 5 protein [Blautia sp.]|nr:glycoside hydrolase family 5 protein [Blautia sp.]
MRIKKWTAVLCVFALCICVCLPAGQVKAAAKFQDASLGALHVEGTKLCDADGNVVQLRGVSTHGLSWYPKYVNDKLFGELHDKWGANVVRLAMYTEEYNGYCSGDANNRKTLKNLVKKGVKLAAKHDMYVIVDWHILSDGNPKTHKKEAKAFFKSMSKALADYDNVLYEICNEPNGGTTWKTIKSYANEIIPVIRENDKDAVIIVGTPTWSQEVDKAAASPLKQDNVMYSLHFYANTHQDSLRQTAEKAIKAGLPLFVTEFGICDASGQGGINKTQANKWIKLLDKYDVSYVAWNLSNKSETCAMIQSSCSKTSGIKRSQLSASGKWVYDLLRKRAGLA